MKKIALILLVLKTAIVFSQTEKEIINFIESKPNIVSLKNEKQLNKTLIKSLPAIEKFLSEKKEDIKEYYTYKKTSKIENGIAYIKLFHKKGFEKEFKIINKKKKDNVINNIILGNLSGKDGVIEIDTKSYNVIKFLYTK
ncbi:hypothetical protein [Wenyingzhuangia sp. IMCC45467]